MEQSCLKDEAGELCLHVDIVPCVAALMSWPFLQQKFPDVADEFTKERCQYIWKEVLVAQPTSTVESNSTFADENRFLVLGVV